MTLRSILVLQSTCDDDESGSHSADPSPHPHNNSRDDDTLGMPPEEDLGETTSFAWQRLQDSTPVVCDLLLLPEVPTVASTGKTGREGMVQPLASRASFQERRNKATQKQYEKTTQISPVHLNPCGMDNVLLFNNLETSNDNFLLSLTSCHYHYEHANGTMLELPVEAVPSTFSFSFTPQNDNEYFFYVPPQGADSSQQQPQEESPAFAEVFVDFDVSEARRVFQDYQRSGSGQDLGRCLVWPWDCSETCPADDEWEANAKTSALGRCIEGACEDAAFIGDDDVVGGDSNDGTFAPRPSRDPISFDGPTPTQAVYLEDDGTSPDVLHSNAPAPSNRDRPSPSVRSSREKPSFRVPTLNEGVRANKSQQDMLLLQELRSRALREEQMLTRVLFGMVGLCVILTVTFMYLFRRVWTKLHAPQLLEPLHDQQRHSQSQESGTKDAIDGIEGGHEPNQQTMDVRTEPTAATTDQTGQPESSMVTPRTKMVRTGVSTHAATPEKAAKSKTSSPQKVLSSTTTTRTISSPQKVLSSSAAVRTISSPKKASSSSTISSSKKNAPQGNSFLLQLQAARCQKAKANTSKNSNAIVTPGSTDAIVPSGDCPAPMARVQPSTPPRAPPPSPTKSPIASSLPLDDCTTTVKAEELSPTSKYEKQFFASRSVRRKKKENNPRPLAPSDPPVSLEQPSGLPDCTAVSAKDLGPNTTAPPMLKSVVTKKAPAAEADPTQLWSPYSSMPPDTKKEKATRKAKKEKQLFVSPFISPIDVSTSSSDDLQDAPSPASTTVSCDSTFLEDYW